MTAFIEPPFNLRVSKLGVTLTYGGVSNKLYLQTGGKRPFVHIVVPTSLFIFMEERLNPNEKALWHAGKAYLYLDMVADNKYVLGLAFRETDEYIDLWSYTKATLPKSLARVV